MAIRSWEEIKNTTYHSILHTIEIRRLDFFNPYLDTVCKYNIPAKCPGDCFFLPGKHVQVQIFTGVIAPQKFFIRDDSNSGIFTGSVLVFTKMFCWYIFLPGLSPLAFFAGVEAGGTLAGCNIVVI